MFKLKLIQSVIIDNYVHYIFVLDMIVTNNVLVLITRDIGRLVTGRDGPKLRRTWVKTALS